jgi:hypothetical protein
MNDVYLDLLRARDRDDIFSLAENPRKCDLTSCSVMSFTDAFKAICNFEDIREVLFRIPETRRGSNGGRNNVDNSMTAIPTWAKDVYNHLRRIRWGISVK